MSNDLDFDLKAMKEAIKKCDDNIKVFEQAIVKEMNTKMEYNRIIRTLEEKEATRQAISKNVILELVHSDDDPDIDGG